LGKSGLSAGNSTAKPVLSAEVISISSCFAGTSRRAFGAAAGSWLVGELNGAMRYLLSAVILGAAWRLTMRVAMSGLSSRT